MQICAFADIFTFCNRNDEWNTDRPKEEGKGYEGPAGMDPDGVIDSNWDEVISAVVMMNTIDCKFVCLQVCENFDDMNLKEELLRGIYAYGFEKPSAIQQRAIVPVIKVNRVHASQPWSVVTVLCSGS